MQFSQQLKTIHHKSDVFTLYALTLKCNVYFASETQRPSGPDINKLMMSHRNWSILYSPILD